MAHSRRFRCLYLFASLLVNSIVLSESHSQIVYVNSAAVGANNGTSWSNAYLRLGDALANAPTSSEVWVASASGVPYRPDQSALHPSGSGDRNASFVIKATVKVYGGFIGIESSLGQRSPTLNPTILSGDLLQNDVDADLQNFGANSTFAENSAISTTMAMLIQPTSRSCLVHGAPVRATRHSRASNPRRTSQSKVPASIQSLRRRCSDSRQWTNSLPM